MFLRYKKWLLPWLVLILFIPCTWSNAQIQWSENGIPIASATTAQVHMSSVSDGNGGAFLTWENNPSSDINIYAQWIDGSGNLRWGSSGVVVNSAGLDQKYPSIVPDGSGGVIIAWQDESSNNIYVQRLNASGSRLWGTWGMIICSATGEQTLVKMVTDGQGGAILIWIDKRNWSASVLYAQRIDGSGNSLWTSNGIPVTTITGVQSSHVLVSDGAGGVFVAWQDYRNGNYDVFAQRLTSAGAQAWSSAGVPVASLVGNQISPATCISGNNIFISWEDTRTGSSDIYAQELDPSGNPLWTVNGIPICVATGAQMNSRVVHDGAGGAIITWVDNRTNYDIYAQRVNAAGTALWTANGKSVNHSDGYQYAPEIASDGSGGSFIVWNDNRTGSNIELYAQHLNGNGDLLWSEAGFPIVAEEGTQQSQVVLSDGSGGVLTFWQDGRDGKSDIYAQHINDNLSFVQPASSVLWAGTQQQTIQWALRSSQTRFDHITLRYSSTPGDGFPQIIAQGISPTQNNYTWTPTSVNSTNVRIKIQAHNAQDAILCEYISGEFTIDSDPPAVFNLLSPADGTVVDLKPIFQWESTTDNLSGFDHFELWIDNALFQDALQTTSYTLTDVQALSPGPHTWTVKALDHAGLVRQAGSTRTLTATEDNVPPSAFHLLSPPHNTWTASSHPAFTWEASIDTGSGLKKYQLYLNGQLRLDNIPPTSTSTNALTLTAGDHSWFITAVDSCDNATSSETWTVRMDNVPPRAFSLLQPADNVWIRDATPAFVWEATSDTSTGIGLAEYQLWIDGILTIDHIPGDSTHITLPEGKALSEGNHVWKIVAKDSLGNSRSSRISFTTKVDVTPPQAFSLTSPADGSYTTVLSPALSWQSSSDEGSGFLKYELWMDGSLNKDNLTVTSTVPQSPLTEGQHTWFVRAVDNAGNVSTSSTLSFTADATPPVPFSLISPSDGAILHLKNPTFTWRSTKDLVSGFNKFQLTLDGQIIKDNLSDKDTTAAVSTPLENGPHTWNVTAWDIAGNNRVSATFNFTIDCNPPEITSPSSATAMEDILFSYTATATDPENDPVSFSFARYPSWLSPSGNDRISGTPTEGTQDTSFLVIATDGMYFDSLKVTLSVQPVNDPPQVTSSASATATEDVLFTYTATATDPENDPVSFIFQQYPAWLSPSGNKISGIPTEGIQSGTFTVIASDGQLTDTLLVTLTVTSVNDPPQITSSASTTATEDILFTYTATATDPENDPVSFIFQQYPAWLSPSGNKISGIPTEGIQSGTFTVIASDGQLTDTLKVTITVTSVNDPPQITSPASALATEDVLFSYTATATDPENNPVSFIFQQYPAWLSPSGSKISGTPTEGITTGSFIVIASDGALTDTLIVTVTVTPVNDPPEITSPATASGTEDILFTYTVTATDPENDPVSFIFQKYPVWLSPSGSKISGTPKEGARDTSFVVIASDGALTDTLVVSIAVTSVNDPPVITSPDTVSAYEDVPFTYTPTADDPENDEITFIFGQYPKWLSPSGNAISGTSVEGTQDTSFVVIASDGTLTDTLKVVLKCIPVNDPPQITSADTIFAVEGRPFVYRAAATDIDGPRLSIYFVEHPKWLSPSGPEISGTPPNGSPNASFKVIASDTFLQDTLVVIVIINDVNNPPYFDYSLPKPNFSSLDSLTWHLDLDDYASDPDDPDSVLVWTYAYENSLPVSISVDPKSHIASIQVNRLQNNFNIAFTVTDPLNASATDTLYVNILMSGVESIKITDAPKDFILYDNYPNPFNPSTTIRYGIPRPCRVILKIFNMLGQEVATLVDEDQKAGMYEFLWDASSHPSGVYFYHLRTKHYQKVRRMILMK